LRPRDERRIPPPGRAAGGASGPDRGEPSPPAGAAEGIVFVPFFPLHGGGGRALAEIAERHDATPAQIALAWLLKRSPTMLPIPGTLSLEHLRLNLASLEVELSDDEFEALA
jgi:pyridoxine 4-dehydrogenase